MKCRECALTLCTVDTREIESGYITQRTRLCPNGHRYRTFEIDEGLKQTVERTARRTNRIKTFEANAERFERNRAIRALGQQGWKPLAIANEFQLHDAHVRRILRGMTR